MKICTKCHKVKDTSCFGIDRKAPDGLSYVCKTCRKKYSAAYYKKDPEKKKWRGVKSTYGLTKMQYDVIAAHQNHMCPITLLPFSDCKIVIDHNHELKKDDPAYVRGLIEDNINKALGLFRDNPDWLRRAADYLEGKLDMTDCWVLNEEGERIDVFPIAGMIWEAKDDE